LMISTGSEELDRRLGGIPFPSLIMIEGDHGTGKSVLAAQLASGFLASGKRGYIVTTEQTSLDYLRKMREVRINLTKPFLKGELGIAPVNTSRFTWNSQVAAKLLDLLYSFSSSLRMDFLILDSLSVIATFAQERDILEFMKRSRVMVRGEMSMIFTVHPGVFSDSILTRVTSVVDVYLKLSAASIGGRRIKVLERVKTVGGVMGAEAISFDIDPSLGIKVVPLSLSRA